MEAQTPAKGVLLMNEWGKSKMYKAICDCASDGCSHIFDVEADDGHVTVTIFTTQKTKWWSANRWRQIWDILTKGFTEFETSIVLDKQVALNYASVLQSAVKDVEELEKERYGKTKSS